jgi:hypothetical protein
MARLSYVMARDLGPPGEPTGFAVVERPAAEIQPADGGGLLVPNKELVTSLQLLLQGPQLKVALAYWYADRHPPIQPGAFGHGPTLIAAYELGGGT